jgi:hypothetical protein
MLTRGLVVVAGAPIAVLLAQLLASVVHVSALEGGSGVPFFLTLALSVIALGCLAVGTIITALALIRAYRDGTLSTTVALLTIAVVIGCFWLTRFISNYRAFRA